MSEPCKSFIELVVDGKVSVDEIDDFVDVWHRKPNGESLYKYLGMEKSEYALWVRDPDSLTLIIKARREGRSLVRLIDDECEKFELTAEASIPLKAKRLREWLKHEANSD